MSGVLMNDGKVSMLDGKVVMGETDDPCCCATHRQARKCSDGFTADVWMTLADAATLPGAFSLGGICYYFNLDDPPSSTPGTVYTPADVTAYDDCDSCPRCLCGLVVGQTLEVGRPTFKAQTTGLSFPCTEGVNRYEAVRDILNSLPATLQFTITGFTAGVPDFAYTGAQPTFLGITPHTQVGPNRWEWFWQRGVTGREPPVPDMIYIEATWRFILTVTCSDSAMTIKVSLDSHAEGQTDSPPYSGGSCGTGAAAETPTITVTVAEDCNTLYTFDWTNTGLIDFLDDPAGSIQLDAAP